jgi:hypothetical protein
VLDVGCVEQRNQGKWPDGICSKLGSSHKTNLFIIRKMGNSGHFTVHIYDLQKSFLDSLSLTSILQYRGTYNEIRVTGISQHKIKTFLPTVAKYRSRVLHNLAARANERYTKKLFLGKAGLFLDDSVFLVAKGNNVIIQVVLKIQP